jgi:hypothetical protein
MTRNCFENNKLGVTILSLILEIFIFVVKIRNVCDNFCVIILGSGFWEKVCRDFLEESLSYFWGHGGGTRGLGEATLVVTHQCLPSFFLSSKKSNLHYHLG